MQKIYVCPYCGCVVEIEIISILPIGSLAVWDICWTTSVMPHRQFSSHKFNNVLCLAVADCCRCIMRTRLSPGLHISRKDCKHKVAKTLFKLSRYALVFIWL